MKIAIYGAGNYGQYIYSEILNHEHTEISVAFWIDNHVEAQRMYGLNVYAERHFFIEEKYKEIDAIMIGIEDAKTAQEIAVSLLERGYDKIYLACLEAKGSFAYQAKVPILDEEGNFSPCVKFYKEVKPRLDFMGILVTNYCNLNCKSCANFSNIVTEKKLLSVDEFETYLVQLQRKFRGIDRFELLGGEPLLHPQLDQFVLLTRKYFPGADIVVITNGLLLLKSSQELIDAMVISNAAFVISQYRPTRERIADIIRFLEERQVEYTIWQPVTHFDLVLTFKEENGKKVFKKRFHDGMAGGCMCHTIAGGRVHICPFGDRLYEVQDFFNIHIEEEELKEASLDLMSDDVDGWDILQYFKAPTPICKYCSPEYKKRPWETGQPKIEDWIAY